MLWDAFLGNRTVKAQLRGLIDGGRIPHALLLEGEKKGGPLQITILSVPYDNRKAAEAADLYTDLPKKEAYQKATTLRTQSAETQNKLDRLDQVAKADEIADAEMGKEWVERLKTGGTLLNDEINPDTGEQYGEHVWWINFNIWENEFNTWNPKGYAILDEDGNVLIVKLELLGNG